MKDIQSKIEKFCEVNSLNATLESRMLDLVSELGEFSKEVLKSSEYGQEKPRFTTEMADEMGDVIYSLITVCNYFGIDMQETVEGALNKYTLRMQKADKPSS